MLSLEDLKIKFLVRFPLFKDIFTRVKIEFDNSIATACTDGITLYFSPEFMSKLSEEQQLFVFAHELLHVALEHIQRGEGKNHKNWNIATDAVINAYIKKCGISECPDRLVDIVDALNYSAEELYEKLEKEDQEKEKKKQEDNIKDSDKKGSGTDEVETSSNNNSDNNQDKDKDKKETSQESDGKDKDKDKDNKPSNGTSSNNKEDESPGFDDHSRWEDGRKRLKEQKEKSDEKEGNKKSIDEKEQFGKNDDLKDKLDDDFVKGDSKGGNGGKQQGQGNGGGSRGGNSGDNKDSNIIDWRLLLREAIRNDYDYDSQNQEVEDGVVISPFNPQSKPKTEIIIDSSASISDTLIRNFLGECLSIIKNSETDVGFFGSSFSGFTRVRNKEEIDNLEIYDGGGTDFNVAVNSFTNRADNKIIFTDGYASNPTQYCNAIWVVVGDYPPRINPPGGKVIYIQGEQYRRLCENSKGLAR